MTEDEAKAKACCGGGHRPLDNGNCIASVCMAWRWSRVPNPDWEPPHQMAMYPPRNPYSQTPSSIPSATDGFCGLAGSPS